MFEFFFPILFGFYIDNQNLTGDQDISINQYNVSIMPSEYVYSDLSNSINPEYQRTFVTNQNYIMNKKMEAYQIFRLEFITGQIYGNPKLNSFLWLNSVRSKEKSSLISLPISSYYMVDYSHSDYHSIGLGLYHNFFYKKPEMKGQAISYNFQLYSSILPISAHGNHKSIDTIFIPNMWIEYNRLQFGINIFALYGRAYSGSNNFYRLIPSIYFGIIE